MIEIKNQHGNLIWRGTGVEAKKKNILLLLQTGKLLTSGEYATVYINDKAIKAKNFNELLVKFEKEINKLIKGSDGIYEKL